MKSVEQPVTALSPWRKIFKIMLISILLIGLFLPASVLTLRWVNPAFTSFTLLENWSELESDRYNLRDWWVDYDEIPVHIKWAVIASEDQTFYHHRGFDLDSIKEAWEERQQNTRNRGASTISQQVAKNLYLWPAHSFFRKGVEAIITVFIELFWPKERILEMYLNIAEFGPGIYGIAKAADNFFGVNPNQINPEMSARLAAVLPSPSRMRVEPPSPFVAERSKWILRQMTQLTGVSYIQESPAETEDIDPFLFEFETSEMDTIIFELEIDTFDLGTPDPPGVPEIIEDSLPSREK